MSDRIRQLMKERQDSMLAAEGAQPLDLDNYDQSISDQMAPTSQPAPANSLMQTLESLLGPAMASQILEQYMDEQNMQEAMNEGDGSDLMRPMISSVTQLDR